MAKSANTSIYQLKITLRDIRPPIWRRVQVPSNLTLGKLHRVIQAAMGWYECHLHEFEIDGEHYGEPFEELDHIKSERNVRLDKIVPGEKYKFTYLYDMGDGWEHQILIEKILPAEPKTHYPICIKGKRACPPEDCGGAWGYGDLLETLANPEHPEHDSMLEWVGGELDPEDFNLEEINQRLKGL